MALLGYPKEVIQKRMVIGIGVAIILYLSFRYGLKNILATKSNADTPNSNFVGADGTNEDGFTAMRYDATHVNNDGSKGATWIGFKGSDVVGYWQQGRVKIGTRIHSLT